MQIDSTINDKRTQSNQIVINDGRTDSQSDRTESEGPTIHHEYMDTASIAIGSDSYYMEGGADTLPQEEYEVRLYYIYIIYQLIFKSIPSSTHANNCPPPSSFPPPPNKITHSIN